MENVSKEQLLLQNFETATDVIFESNLSLEQLSSMKIIVTIWNKKIIREDLLFVAHEFTSLDTPWNSQIWQDVLEKVTSDIGNLQIPRKMCQKLCDINNYISKSLLYWLIHTYITFYNNSERIDLLTWRPYFFMTLNLFWNALCKSNTYEMKFCNDVELGMKFQRSFLALWYNIPKSLENRIHQDADMIALILYFLPWSISQHVIHYTIHKIETSQKKNVITSKYGRLKCIYFIKHNEWQFYNLYTSYMLSNKEELFKYKQYLINKEGLETAIYFFKHKAIKNGKEFLEFCKKLENDLSDKTFFVPYFIKHRHWDLLEIYMYLFCNENDNYEVKKSLLHKNGFRCIESLIESTGWSFQKEFLKNFFRKENRFDKCNEELLRNYFSEKLRKGDDENDFTILIYFLKWSIEPSADFDDNNLNFLKDTILLYFNDLDIKKIDNLLDAVFRSDKDQVLEFKGIFEKKF